MLGMRTLRAAEQTPGSAGALRFADFFPVNRAAVDRLFVAIQFRLPDTETKSATHCWERGRLVRSLVTSPFPITVTRDL